MSDEQREEYLYKQAMKEGISKWFSGFNGGIAFIVLLMRLGAPAEAHAMLNIMLGTAVFLSILFGGKSSYHQRKILEVAQELEQEERKRKSDG